MKTLPSYPDPFVGRDYHLEAISGLFELKNARLITLFGPGGIGKTRLAVRLGEKLAAAFKDGVCFVPLEVVLDPGLVPRHISQQLGLSITPDDKWADQLVEFLLDKDLLLILDNFEQVIASAGLISRILKVCPHISILITSREVLGLSYEIEYPLGSMETPAARNLPEPTMLLKFEAIRLFLQKARTVLPNFQLHQENAAVIVEICRYLEGLPLPIELSAARLKLFSPEVILRTLQNDTSILQSRAKDVAVRHQTIRNTVSWSYELLSAREQGFFQQLSLFRGGFTLEAVQAVCTDASALELVEAFINKSLIFRSNEVDFRQRFGMLKLIRDFGLEQLDKHPQKATYYQRFTTYYCSFLAAASSKLQTGEAAKWLTLIEAEYENLTETLAWLQQTQPDQAATLGSHFWPYHLNSGLWQEGLQMVESLLGSTVAKKGIAANLFKGAGTLSHNLGHYLKAKDYFRKALEMCESLKDRSETGKALNNVSWAEWRIGNYQQAINYARQAHAIFTELGNSIEQAKSLNNLAWTFWCQGFYEKAAKLQSEILDLHLKAGNRQGVAFARANLANCLLKSGKWQEAEQLIWQSIQLFEELRTRQLLAFAYLIKAEIDLAAGRLKAARRLLFSNCLHPFRKIGDLWGIANCHLQLGNIYFKEQNSVQAKFHYGQSLQLFRNASDKFGEARTCLHLSQLSRATNKKPTIDSFLDRSLGLAEEMGANELLKEAYYRKAWQSAASSAGLALSLLAIADQYAEKLGPYQYQRFSSSIQPLLKEIRLSVVDGDLPQSLLKDGQPLTENVARQERMQKLLKEALTLPPSPPPAAKPVTDAPSLQQQRLPAVEGSFLQRIRRIVEANLPDPQFSIQDLSRTMCISHSQLHRRLQVSTGQSATEFIRSIRMDHAKKLLLKPVLTVTEVAYHTGFKDPAYFHRVFKKTFGMTPTAYREMITPAPAE